MLALAYLNSHFQTGLRTSWIGRFSRTRRRTITPNSRLRQGRRDSLRLRAAHHVGRRPDARREGSHHQQGRARGDLPALQELRARRPAARRWTTSTSTSCKTEYEQLGRDGFRVLAIASKDVEPRDTSPRCYALRQGRRGDLILNGYLAFLDPPKETAAAAIRALQQHGVSVKVVTGDNDLVARKICKEVGLPPNTRCSAARSRDDRRGAGRGRRDDDALRPRVARRQATHHPGPCNRAGTPSASWAMGSTMRRRCGRRTSASASTRRWTSRRNRQT